MSGFQTFLQLLICYLQLIIAGADFCLYLTNFGSRFLDQLTNFDIYLVSFLLSIFSILFKLLATFFLLCLDKIEFRFSSFRTLFFQIRFQNPNLCFHSFVLFQESTFALLLRACDQFVFFSQFFAILFTLLL